MPESEKNVLLPGTEVYAMAQAASKMVDSARNGQPLSDYRSAQNSAIFMKAPTNEIGAYLKSAYWLAVASRILTNADLASSAFWNLTKGTGLAALPLTSSMKDSTATILNSAARSLTPYGGNRNIAAILAILGYQATTGFQEMTKVRADQQVLYNTLLRSGQDVASGAQLARSLVTGQKPRGMSETEWWWEKNKWYAGGTVLALVVAGYIFRPYVQAYNKRGE